MLARRFTIVCLLITLFGMLFSMLVAQAGRSPRAVETGVVARCAFDQGFVCAPPDNR